MDSVHRTLDGDWAECANHDCNLKFHVPGLTVEQAKLMPLQALLPLLEVLDPPDHILSNGTKLWVGETVANSPHRDYDLPAYIHSDGSIEWWQDGEPHRDGGKPAIIFASGHQEFWEHGKQQQVLHWF